MKYRLIILSALFLLITNCSLDSDSDTPQQTFRSIWHLINVSGGIAGVDDDFTLETIVWSFDEGTSTLTIENNNTDDTKQDGLDSGSYTFSFIVESNNQFLVVDSMELGEIVVTQNSMVIDENVTSTGTGADGLVYTFQRTLVAE